MLLRFLTISVIFLSSFPIMFGQESSPLLQRKVSKYKQPDQLLLKSNVVPWTITVPNLGVEYKFENQWSIDLEVAYCPWKLSDNFSVKTIAILPEGRFWLKDYKRGSFFNLHFTAAWYNMRYHHYRYQDYERPLLGAGIGYGYRLNFDEKWGVEFSIGAGFFSTRYNRYYNVANGALADIRTSTYWGIDRLGITFSYNLADL